MCNKEKGGGAVGTVPVIIERLHVTGWVLQTPETAMAEPCITNILSLRWCLAVICGLTTAQRR